MKKYLTVGACTLEMRNEYKILIGRPEGKRPLGRSRHGLRLGVG
jgi:hypothetical protein